ncbi:helix-turn-helix domain-containing protein [Gordonia sp. ABSL49_1]|uniref:helix-turn-helix domain-containing protein n=1 Tax=Gordonia sp. ABSL49_1 TaxID=2920941 RepID=UPI001F0D80F1|nr:helix-turn-helix domain-containing protein [Gordonia sp. ABSL49_1]MCH5643312.1 helix-turn-helix domain-containing protein [Gordonia sp. ABSL49_1]
MSPTDVPVADRNLLIEARQRQQAQELLAMTGAEFTELTVTGPDHEFVAVPSAIAGVIRDVVAAIASGTRISVAALPEELTTTVAAEQLGVSRPTLMKMINRGDIAAHRVGSHHRVLTEDVVEYKRKRIERQRRAIDELRVIDAELDKF